MSSKAATLEPTALEAVWEAAREMARKARLPRSVRDALAAWAEGRLADGIEPSALPALLRGQDDRALDHVDDRTFDTEQALAQSRTNLEAALVAGSLDEQLDALQRAELAGRARDDVLTLIVHRSRHVAAEAMLFANLDAVEAALETGDWDDDLDDLWELEASTLKRKGAFELLESRRDALGAFAVLDGTVAELEAFLARTANPPTDLMITAERRGKNRKTALRALERAKAA